MCNSRILFIQNLTSKRLPFFRRCVAAGVPPHGLHGKIIIYLYKEIEIILIFDHSKKKTIKDDKTFVHLCIHFTHKITYNVNRMKYSNDIIY